MAVARCTEFDCCECRSHIVLIAGDRPEPPLCAMCQSLPGWFRDPQLRELLDPDHDGRDPAEDALHEP